MIIALGITASIFLIMYYAFIEMFLELRTMTAFIFLLVLGGIAGLVNATFIASLMESLTEYNNLLTSLILMLWLEFMEKVYTCFMKLIKKKEN